MGGAVYIIEKNTNKVPNRSQKRYYLKDTTFSSNEAYIGGAIYLDNAQATYFENCMFSNNKVIKSSMNKYKKYSGSGGGIYYTCDYDNRDCTLELAGTN